MDSIEDNFLPDRVLSQLRISSGSISSPASVSADPRPAVQEFFKLSVPLLSAK